MRASMSCRELHVASWTFGQRKDVRKAGRRGTHVFVALDMRLRPAAKSLEPQGFE